MSAEELPLAVLAADVLLAGGVLLLADCVSLVELAAPELEACGGFELGLVVVLGEVELGLFGLLLSVVPEGELGFAVPEPLVPEGLELIDPLEVSVPVAPVPLAAPMPLDEELPAAQWSEICRTSETWNVLPVLLLALVPPVLDVDVLEVLLALPVPVNCTC